MDDDSQALDHELDDELRRVAALLDPVPDALVRAAEGAFAWRSLDAQLAELAFDSLADSDRLALVRGGGEPRLLTFHAGDVTIEVEVVLAGAAHPPTAGAAHRIIGQVLPPGPARVQVRHPEGVLEVEADELGRFAAEGVSAGPVSLRCEPAGAASTPAVTEWVPI